MTWGSLNPHPPTSDFQVGDRVVVTGKPFGRASLAIPDVGMTGEVVHISLKSGSPIVAMDMPFKGAMQIGVCPHHQYLMTYPRGLGIERVIDPEIAGIDVGDFV